MVLVFNPLWLIKTRLAIQEAVDPASKYTGLTGCGVCVFGFLDLFVRRFSELIVQTLFGKFLNPKEFSVFIAA